MQRSRKFLVRALLAALFSLSVLPGNAQQSGKAVASSLTAVMDTSFGRITCELFKDQAPKTVANFVGLAEGTQEWTNLLTGQKSRAPLYNGTIFHRVIAGSMIQGGDPTGSGGGGPGYSFKDEFNPDLLFDRPGRLAMANSGPNTNGSQFFISVAPAEPLNNHHTIFGQCDQVSLFIVRAIASVKRDSNDRPLSPVVLRKVTIVRPGQPIPPLPYGAR